jgi:hypothetical protein
MSLFVAEPIFETHEPVYFAMQSTLTRAHEQARQMQAFSGLSAPDRDSDRHCQPHLFAIADRHTRRRIDARLALFAKRRSRPLGDESGVFSALLVYRQGIWKISALREQSSAKELEIIQRHAPR